MRFRRNVLALGLTSFFNDTSSELAYWILPLFLTRTMGAGASALGWIEGLAEGTASFARLLSGWWTDRIGRRKPFVAAGYVVANIVKPLLAFTTTPLQVLAIRVTDRFAKGTRTAPRDALLAESVEPARRGGAFGFRQAMDSAGAIIGPLAAFLLLRAGFDFRSVFFFAAIPGAISIVLVLAFVRETGHRHSKLDAAVAQPAPHLHRPEKFWRPNLPGRFYGLLGAVSVFAIGNSSDLFLVLRAQQFGIVAAAPLLGLLFNVTYTLLAWPLGHLSDRIPRYRLLGGGYMVFAVVYVGFATAAAGWHIWLLFALYGLYYAMAEGVLKALIADLVIPEARGRAYGLLATIYGILVLAASLIAGQLWESFGPSVPFTFSACTAALAALLILTVSRTPPHLVQQ